MVGIELLHNFLDFKKEFATIFLLLPLILVNPAFAQSTEIQMDWLIEGQLEEKTVTTQEAEIVSNYEELVEKEAKPVYEKFITGNEYSVGDSKITIESEEGQILAGMLIEQRDLRQDSFEHKIKYYDRFSDGYIEIAEALLDPIGDSKYLIKGQAFDYNPNSNLELFVLERGYSLDNLEAIPNDIFTPKEFTLGRQLMDDATRSGEGAFDLREYSPNYLLLTREQIQERMNEAFSEQTSQLFDGILSGEQLPPGKLPDLGIGVPSSTSESESIFDNFKFEKPKFENTRHVRDSLQSNPFQITDPAQSFENISLLLLIPVFVGLAVFGYLLRKKLSQRKLEEPLLLVSKPQTDYRELTQQMINKSQSLFDNNQRKEAFEALSQAIRYYYSQNMEIYKEMTNHELLNILYESKSDAYGKVRNWLLLCGSVEYAKYDSSDADFRDALSKFAKEISK
ncbi:MAG: hypothetical protein EA447_05450 [Nitrosopumilus sp.]|nr:MAG: hypothetical protein EA447_05450 [Nitrosopumilus sp.]